MANSTKPDLTPPVHEVSVNMRRKKVGKLRKVNSNEGEPQRKRLQVWESSL